MMIGSGFMEMEPSVGRLSLVLQPITQVLPRHHGVPSSASSLSPPVPLGL